MTRDTNIMALGDAPALVLEPHEQAGLRGLLNRMADDELLTITLERRGLTNPLIATCEHPHAGEATYLISTGTFAELDGYPPPE